MSSTVHIENRGSVMIVRFVRPEIRNPLSVFVLDELQQIVRALPPECMNLIFTGTGNVFASGADLREIAAVSASGAREFALRGQRLMTEISDLNIKTIAAINGFCFGGALDLALSCDIRIAQPDSTFSHPGVGLGIITGWGGTQRLPRLIGEAMSLEMFLSACPVDAERALQMGLVDEIAADAVSESLANHC